MNQDLWLKDFEAKSDDNFEKHLQNINIKLIPILDKSTFQGLRDGQLVRYYGFVQDMMNPEFFRCKCKIQNKNTGDIFVRSGKYREAILLNQDEEYVDDDDDSELGERVPIYCGPIPAQNKWNLDIDTEKVTILSLNENCSKKRSLNEDMTEVDSAETSAKRQVVTPAQGNESANFENIYSFSNNGPTCMIKIYDDNRSHSASLNDRIEVIGFLSVMPYEVETCSETASRPPSSLVPRIHVLSVKKLQHFNSLLPQQVRTDVIEDNCQQIYQELHLAFTEILFGDSLAADYLLCHLISRVYIKKDCLKLGHFSLNISGIKSPDYASQLYQILELLLPQSLYLPLSIDFMNTTRLTPKKDYSRNKLETGLLQLADDTQLLIDETKLEEGQLNDLGCRNMSALHILAQQQLVKYDFTFYTIDYDTDIPVLIISEGKSIIPVSTRVKLNIDESSSTRINETFEAAKFYLNKEMLHRARCYLTKLKLLDFEIGDEIMKTIEQDFVQMRQDDKKVTPNSLHSLLVLARLVSLTQGQTTLTHAAWSKAKCMEHGRKLRLSQNHVG